MNFKVMQKLLPQLKTLGLIYNSSEANSVATIKKCSRTHSVCKILSNHAYF